MADASYIETFDEGPGGWYGWISNAGGPRSLNIQNGAAMSRSPWWIDYNHAPPGVGYLNLLYMLNTAGRDGEHQREVAGPNRFIEGNHSTRFTDARMTLRLKGELNLNGAQLVLLCQGGTSGLTSGWLFTGQPIQVTPDWSEQQLHLQPDTDQWQCLGARHDRADFYGSIPLADILNNVNVNILLVLFPLNIVPMGDIPGDPHILRPEKDYPVWRSRLPEGYVMLDEVRIDYA